MNNTNVDSYLQDGCGRCDKFATPECKVHLWTDALVALRRLLLESDLVEEMKWGSPCYTLGGKNVVMLVSRKDYCALSFLKGSAFVDEDDVLESAGPNSRFARLLKFTTAEQVAERSQQVASLIRQALDVERSGVKIEPQGEPEPMPAELEERLASDPNLTQAFEALTPGRRRSYILHVSGAKQSTTRQRRVEKCVPKIYLGKGFNER